MPLLASRSGLPQRKCTSNTGDRWKRRDNNRHHLMTHYNDKHFLALSSVHWVFRFFFYFETTERKREGDGKNKEKKIEWYAFESGELCMNRQSGSQFFFFVSIFVSRLLPENWQLAMVLPRIIIAWAWPKNHRIIVFTKMADGNRIIIILRISCEQIKHNHERYEQKKKWYIDSHIIFRKAMMMTTFHPLYHKYDRNENQFSYGFNRIWIFKKYLADLRME